MNWEYKFESAESERGAIGMLGRLEDDGWEPVGFSRCDAEVVILLRRQQRDGSEGLSLLEQWYQDPIEAE
jgi:hypothetical protein